MLKNNSKIALIPAYNPDRKLLAKLILASSNEGDTVFDPFLGSGSTSVTAKKLGRHYSGIEQNPQYCVWVQELHAALHRGHRRRGRSAPYLGRAEGFKRREKMSVDAYNRKPQT